MRPKAVIFTDLDGTLLEHDTYSFDQALPALKLIKKQGIPLVLCSSKTRSEIERWRERLDNRHPYIAENGGGIFVPTGCFSTAELEIASPGTTWVDGWHVIVLGTPYAELRRALEEIRGEGFEVEGFGDMEIDKVVALTGLPLEEAELARKRDFDEPFTFRGDKARFEMLLASIERRGLRCTRGGRLNHLMGNNDKGKAVDVLKALYRERFGDPATIALGDGLNDLPMLERVDCPVLVRNHRGQHDPSIVVSNLIKTEGIGPKGWNEAVLKLIHERVFIS
jgi:mannosyl-3-phosphoglycerate phosphatase